MTDEEYMKQALDEARRAARAGEVPIGAVVVYEPREATTRASLAAPRIIARSGNCREATQNPAGHAEFLALCEAARVLGQWRLSDCSVYVTLEPCLMCAGLMHQARVRRCVYGAHDPKAGALGTLYRINEDTRLNHTFEVTAGICEDACAQLLRDFFAVRRNKAKEAQQAQAQQQTQAQQQALQQAQAQQQTPHQQQHQQHQSPGLEQAQPPTKEAL